MHPSVPGITLLLWYNPEERWLSGSYTFEECKKWCFENDHCGLALWFKEQKECHIYRFNPTKRNEREVLEWCDASKSAAFVRQYGQLLQTPPERYCPLDEAMKISCTSYQGKQKLSEN